MNDPAEQYEAAALRYRTLQKELAALNRKLAGAAQAGEQRLAISRAYATFLSATVAVLKAGYARADRKVLLHLDSIAESAYRSFLKSAADLEDRLAPLRERVATLIRRIQDDGH